MRRIGREPGKYNVVDDIFELVFDEETRKILHGIRWHTRKEKELFKMGELRRFAMCKHDNNCIKTPERHEKKWSKLLRWEKTELRLSNLSEMGFVEKVPREGTKLHDYKLSDWGDGLEGLCQHIAERRGPVTGLELWMLGFLPEIFKRILRRMVFYSRKARRLHYLPAKIVRIKVPEEEIQKYPDEMKDYFSKGIPQFEPGPPIRPLERSEIYIFGADYRKGVAVMELDENTTIESMAGVWDGERDIPETGSPSDIVDNIGYLFETMFSHALDEQCPDGWMVLACSKRMWEDVFWKNLGKKESMLANDVLERGKEELEGRAEKLEMGLKKLMEKKYGPVIEDFLRPLIQRGEAEPLKTSGNKPLNH